MYIYWLFHLKISISLFCVFLRKIQSIEIVSLAVKWFSSQWLFHLFSHNSFTQKVKNNLSIRRWWNKWDKKSFSISYHRVDWKLMFCLLRSNPISWPRTSNSVTSMSLAKERKMEVINISLTHPNLPAHTSHSARKFITHISGAKFRDFIPIWHLLFLI